MNCSNSPNISRFPWKKQVTILYAGTKGYLDAYPKEAVPAYEAGLYPFVESRFPEVFSGLKEKQKIDDELEAKLKECLTAYAGELRKPSARVESFGFI